MSGRSHWRNGTTNQTVQGKSNNDSVWPRTSGHTLCRWLDRKTARSQTRAAAAKQKGLTSMAFTYNAALTDTRSKVRFWIQDTITDKGPLPNNDNFTDAEIDGLLTIEDSWQLAVGAGFETLAAAWARHTSFSVHGGSFTRSDASRIYLALAKEWRVKYGESSTAPKRPTSIAVTKADYGFDVS